MTNIYLDTIKGLLYIKQERLCQFIVGGGIIHQSWNQVVPTRLVVPNTYKHISFYWYPTKNAKMTRPWPAETRLSPLIG
jgi:hypothetical protein